MILGTFHMKSQNDIHNLKDTNRITSMQDELSIIVEKLSKYKPTKIFVEFEKKNQDKLDNYYRRYLEDKLLSTNEIVQIAFPLAKKLNCPVIAIDWMERGAAERACGDVINEMSKYKDLQDEIEQYKMPEVNLNYGILKNLIELNTTLSSDNTKAYYINYALL